MKQERGSCERSFKRLWRSKSSKVKTCEDYVPTITLNSPLGLEQCSDFYTNLGPLQTNLYKSV